MVSYWFREYCIVSIHNCCGSYMCPLLAVFFFSLFFLLLFVPQVSNFWEKREIYCKKMETTTTMNSIVFEHMRNINHYWYRVISQQLFFFLKKSFFFPWNISSIRLYLVSQNSNKKTVYNSYLESVVLRTTVYRRDVEQHTWHMPHAVYWGNGRWVQPIWLQWEVGRRLSPRTWGCPGHCHLSKINRMNFGFKKRSKNVSTEIKITKKLSVL